MDNLIEHFRDKERRKEFFKEYKEIEMLYEIISPDAFLRPFIEDYATLSSIYAVVCNAYARQVYVVYVPTKTRGYLPQLRSRRTPALKSALTARCARTRFDGRGVTRIR